MATRPDTEQGTDEHIADTLDNAEDNGGTRQAGTDEQPTDIRSLLSDAYKEDAAGRLRDASGRFAAAPEAPQAAPEAPVAPQTPSQPPEVAAFLSTLAPEQRQQAETLLTARETAYNQHVQSLNDQLRGHEGIGSIVGPRVQAWAEAGWRPEQALHQLLELSDFAGSDPVNFVQWFASQHGLDLASLNDDYVPPDPNVTRLEQRLASIEQGFANRQNEEQSRLHNDTVSSVRQFAQEVGADGVALRPFFAEVSNDLMQLLPGIVNANPNMSNSDKLQLAYDRAVWANPGTRQKLLEQQQAARAEEARQRVAKARNAGASITGAPNDGVTPSSSAPASSLRDELKRAYAAHSA